MAGTREHIKRIGPFILVWLVIHTFVSRPSITQAENTKTASPSIAILLTDHPTYREPLAVIEQRLKAKDRPYQIHTLPKGEDAKDKEKIIQEVAGQKPNLLLTIGREATAFAAEKIPDLPMIFCMVPNAFDLPYSAKENPQHARFAGITTDIDPKELMEWITKAVAKPKNLVILYSARSKKTAEAFRTAGKKMDLVTTLIETQKKDFAAAVKTLAGTGSDGVVMLPDAAIYDTPNTRHLLLWAIRSKVPVWTFSSNIVKAGALAGQFCDMKETGVQTAEMVEKVLAGGKVAELGIQYAKTVKRAVNERTAELIEVTFAPEVLKATPERYGRAQDP